MHYTVHPVHTEMAWGQSFIQVWTGFLLSEMNSQR